MAQERLPVVQEMILARDEAGRRAALDRLLPMQQSDFEGIFEAMAGLPGHDPPARPAAARVPADARGGDRPTRCGSRIKRAARGEPDARHARLPARPAVARDLRDAGARDRPRRAARSRERTGRAAARRDHAPARRLPRGARAPARADRARRRRGAGDRVPLRHDDRAAARRASAPTRSPRSPTSARSARTTSRRRRSASRATTPRASSSRTTSRTAILERNPFEVLDQEGVGDLMRIAIERGRGVEAGPQDGHLRRARRRAASRSRSATTLGLDYVSCSPVPRAARAPRRRAGGARRRGRHRARHRRLSGPSPDRAVAGRRRDDRLRFIAMSAGSIATVVVGVGLGPDRPRRDRAHGAHRARRRAPASSSGSAATSARSTRACTSSCRSSTGCARSSTCASRSSRSRRSR